MLVSSEIINVWMCEGTECGLRTTTPNNPYFRLTVTPTLSAALEVDLCVNCMADYRASLSSTLNPYLETLPEMLPQG